jgi:hypothetical protein
MEEPEEVGEERCLAGRLVELYDPRDDEEVADNIAGENPRVVSLMRRRLEELRTDRASLREEFVLSAEEEAKLKSLGYLQ